MGDGYDYLVAHVKVETVHMLSRKSKLRMLMTLVLSPLPPIVWLRRKWRYLSVGDLREVALDWLGS